MLLKDNQLCSDFAPVSALDQEPAALCDFEAMQDFTLGGDGGGKRANKSDDLQSGFWRVLSRARRTRMDKINDEKGSPHMCKQFSTAEQPGAK